MITLTKKFFLLALFNVLCVYGMKNTNSQKDPRLLLELPDEGLICTILHTTKDDIFNAVTQLIRLSCVCKKLEHLRAPNNIKIIFNLDQRTLDDNLSTHIFFGSDRDLTPFFKLLITMGARMNLYYKDLHSCICSTNNTYLIKHFITTHKPNINKQYKDGDTPLYLAVQLNKPSIVELLLEHGADMYLADENGRTPTFMALLLGKAECLKVLIRHGLDTTIEYDYGHDFKQTIAQWAQTAKNEEVYTLATGKKMPKEWYEKSSDELLNDACTMS